MIELFCGSPAMRAVAARKSSAALSLRAGFHGTNVLPFSEIPGPKWPVLGAMPTMMSYGFSRFSEYYRYMYNTYGVIVDATVLGEATVIFGNSAHVLPGALM